MNKIFLSLALACGLLFVAPQVQARDHGHHHQGGQHHNHGAHRHHHHGNPGFHYNSGRSGFSIYIGPGYNRYPAPYPRPYPAPYPRPYPSPAPINVLVTEYCHGHLQTRWVTAYWNRNYGGWWFYDCNGIYRRAR